MSIVTHRCAICNSTEHLNALDIDDFDNAHSFICSKCLNSCKGRLRELIEEAQYTQSAMEQAQANHYRACETLRNYIKQRRPND